LKGKSLALKQKRRWQHQSLQEGTGKNQGPSKGYQTKKKDKKRKGGATDVLSLLQRRFNERPTRQIQELM